MFCLQSLGHPLPVRVTLDMVPSLSMEPLPAGPRDTGIFLPLVCHVRMSIALRADSPP